MLCINAFGPKSSGLLRGYGFFCEPIIRRLVCLVVGGASCYGCCHNEHARMVQRTTQSTGENHLLNGSLDPSDPKVQESVIRRYGITDPAVQHLVKGLMLAHYPERLSTPRDVDLAKADAVDVDIRDLPLEDYPLLKKFKQVEQVYLGLSTSVPATDQHLEALASLNFPHVVCVTANNCHAITDKGVQSLSRLYSLTQLGLEGTSITDAACETMAKTMHITDLNVANCSGITFHGLQALAASDALQDISFSNERLTAKEVSDLLDSFKSVKRCEIVDPQGTLDAQKLVAKGETKHIQVVLRQHGIAP